MEDEGVVVVEAGGQASNPRIYSQASPIVHDLQLSSGVDAGGRAAPVGVTRGGFRLWLDVGNLGRVQDPPWQASVRVTVGGKTCVLDALRGVWLGEHFMLDPTLYQITGDTIVRGVVE